MIQVLITEFQVPPDSSSPSYPTKMPPMRRTLNCALNVVSFIWCVDTVFEVGSAARRYPLEQGVVSKLVDEQ